MSVEMYNSRMKSYYPQVVSAIEEFKSIIDTEAPEFDDLHTNRLSAIDDAYLLTMHEGRVEKWENILGITPLSESTIQDRRETIVARIRGQGKLNTELINAIVNTFTGGTAESYVLDSVLYVEITPPPNNKAFLFPNVEQELRHKVPAHLDFKVSRNYFDWRDIKDDYATWQDVKDSFANWNSVYVYSPFK